MLQFEPPGPDWYEPAWHSMHCSEPEAFWKVPAPHSVQLDEPTPV